MPVAVKEIKIRLVQGAWEETDCAVRVTSLFASYLPGGLN